MKKDYNKKEGAKKNDSGSMEFELIRFLGKV
jgi:hypothetical protein